MEEINKLISKGFELHKNGDFKGALRNYLKVDKSDNANSTLLFLIGNVYLQLNEIDNSINYFKKSISKDPNNISALNNLGGALQRNKKYKEAINVYEKAIKIKPDHIDALTNLANSSILYSSGLPKLTGLLYLEANNLTNPSTKSSTKQKLRV